MAKAEGDGFEQRAPEMRGRMAKAQSGERAARERILNWRLFTEEIG